MGTVIEEIVRANSPLSRLVAADYAEENGLDFLVRDLRDTETLIADLPYGYGYGNGNGDGYGYGYGNGDGYGNGYGYGYGGIGSRQW